MPEPTREQAIEQAIKVDERYADYLKELQKYLDLWK